MKYETKAIFENHRLPESVFLY